jgi:RNA polymerase sigma factor for flagellar operon FliA
VAAPSSRFAEIWRAYQRTGDEALKAELARQYMPALVRTAERIRWEMGGRPDVNDLVSAGAVGLLEAFERFDPTRGVEFETYCNWRVVGAMHDDQRKFDWASGALRLKARRLRRAADEIANARGHRPSDEELAEALGISAAEVAEARRHADQRKPASIDAAAEGDSSAQQAALGDSRLDPSVCLQAEEARALLLGALKGLPDKQRYVLLLYYFEQLKMAQIGLVLGLSEGRICQLHREALATLVRRLGRRKDELLEALGA